MHEKNDNNNHNSTRRPSHAIYFACYEKCKTLFGFEHAAGTDNILATGAAGACATIAADAIMTPFDVIKQRLQIGVTATATCTNPLSTVPSNPATAKLPCRAISATDSCRKATSSLAGSNFVRFTGMWHCFSHTVRTEGIRALYLSYPTTLIMNIPFQSIHFSAYEYVRHLLQTTELFGPYSSYSPVPHLISGAVAGAAAAFLTTPLDVTKTLLQTRGISSCAEIRQTDSFLRAFILIWRRQGFFGYWRGARARVIAHMPATAISWSVYEYFKWAFTANNSSASALVASVTTIDSDNDTLTQT